MQKIINFVKTTALGGLILIVPLAVLVFALGYIFGLLVDLNNAIAQHIPYEAFGHPMVVALIAALSVVLICFTAGLIVRTSFGSQFAHKINALLVDKLPMYGLIQSITRRFSGNDVLEFTPVEVDLHGSGAMNIAFLIEELPDQRYAVFVPSSPALTIGQLYIVPATNVNKLDSSPRVAIDAITQWGSGTSLIYSDTVEKTDQTAPT